MGELFETVAKITASSKDIAVFWQELISFVRDMLVSKYSGEAETYLDLTKNEAQMLQDCASKFTLAELIYFCKVLDEGSAAMVRTPQNKRITAEMCLLRMCRPELDASSEALSARIAKVEDRLTLLSMTGVSAAVAPAAEIHSEKAEVKAEESAATAPEPRQTQDMGYDSVHDISEAVGRINAVDPGLAEYLLMSEISVSRDGKRLSVLCDGFPYMMMDTAEAKNNIAEAFALAKITDGKAQVELIKHKVEKKNNTAADELGGML